MWYHTHTHTQCATLLLLGKHRCDNLARTRLFAGYPGWPYWQLQWCVPATHPRLRVVEVHRLSPSRTPQRKKSQTEPFNSRLALPVDFLGLRKKDSLTRSTTCSKTDGRPECSLSLIRDASYFNEIPVPLQNGLVSRRIHIKFEFKSTLHGHNTLCFMKFQHASAALLWSERHLAFNCPLATDLVAGGKIKSFLS